MIGLWQAARIEKSELRLRTLGLQAPGPEIAYLYRSLKISLPASALRASAGSSPTRQAGKAGRAGRKAGQAGQAGHICGMVSPDSKMA